MLYYIFQYLDKAFDVPGAGVFQYITFRSALAFILSLLIATIYGKKIINYLRNQQVGETVRELGLEGQTAKAGTPTMGGIIIILATLIPVFLLAKLNNIYIILLIMTTIWMGTIGFIDDYVYSGSNFTNVMTTFSNLYEQFEADMIGNKKYYIASGFDSNKKFKITPITSFDISENSYSIGFDTTKVTLDSNIVYFIYPDIRPIDQGINLSNLPNPNYEDYYKIYYTDYTSTYSGEMYEPDSLLLPTCVLKYNLDTRLFDKIELSQSVTKDDYIFMYNDVFVYNTQSQKNQYILINNKLFTINDISSGSYIYSSNIFVENTSIQIVDGIASINELDTYLIYSTETSLEFIDSINNSNTFVTSTYTSPYEILYTISSDSFYFTNRFAFSR